jgi:signal transduction histidine kinase
MKDVILSVFQARSYPELAAIVRAVGPRVVDRWILLLKDRIPVADELTLQQLRNSLPRTLERLAVALESDRPAATRELMVESEEHGLDRLRNNYQLIDLLVEFDMLRPVLIEAVAAELKRDLDLVEFTALNIGVDLVSRRSVVAYVSRQTQLLTQASHMQSRFFAFLSHDIRGGLNAVLMNIDLLKLDLVDDPRFGPALEDLEAMRRSLLNTVAIMTRYMEAERLRAGAVQPKICRIDLSQVVADIDAQYRSAAAAKGIVLAHELDKGLELDSDQELISMILQNLVGNAIKYSSRGTVAIRASQQLPHGPWELSVSDQGPGIPQEKVNTLFEAYRRGDTHGQAGLGLGLSIVDHAAKLLGAKVKVDSTPGTGTTIHLQFTPKTGTASPSLDGKPSH